MLTPPRCSITYATNDLDEANALQSPRARIRRQCVGRGNLGMRAWRVYLGSGAIGWSSTTIGQRVSAEGDVPLVHVPVRGAFTYRIGRRHFDAMPGRLVFVPPNTEYVVAYDAGATMLAFVPDAGELSAERSAIAARRRVLGMALPELLNSPGMISNLGSILAEWRDLPAMDAGGPVAVHYRGRLTAWLATLLAARQGGWAAGAAAEDRLRRVEDWIDAHLAEPITLGRLCWVAGLEASGLCKSFLQRRGISPMQWVFERRIAAARLRMMEACASDTVIRIAHDCGLVHAGRFSVAYRRRYGESPSLTLGRAQLRI